ASQRKVEGADLEFLPRHVTEYRIAAHAHDLGIQLGELIAVRVVRRGLRCSSRGPIGRIKSQDDIFLAAEFGKRDAVLVVAGAGRDVESRSRIADLEGWHISSPSSSELGILNS